MAVMTRSAVARAVEPTPTLSLEDVAATSIRGRTTRQPAMNLANNGSSRSRTNPGSSPRRNPSTAAAVAAPTGVSTVLMSSPVSMAVPSAGAMNTPIRPSVDSNDTDNEANQSKKPPASPTICGICLSDVSGIRQAKIPECNHVFCYDCIRKWSQVENSCPLCKKRFTSIATTTRGTSCTDDDDGRSNNENHDNGRDGDTVLEFVPPRTQGVRGGPIQVPYFHGQLGPPPPPLLFVPPPAFAGPPTPGASRQSLVRRTPTPALRQPLVGRSFDPDDEPTCRQS